MTPAARTTHCVDSSLEKGKALAARRNISASIPIEGLLCQRGGMKSIGRCYTAPMGRAVERRKLIPGSTGWSVRDLDDPKIEAEWEAGHFQIIEGVLALMPPAYWDNSSALRRLVKQVERHLEGQGVDDDFGFE